jgi:hypothetical protein
MHVASVVYTEALVASLIRADGNLPTPIGDGSGTMSDTDDVDSTR